MTLEDYVASEAQRLADRVFEGDPIKLAEFISERFRAGDPAVTEGARPAPRPGRGGRRDAAGGAGFTADGRR
ncbi:MAG TPA: hypothetical protein VGG68_01445 [Caulobacteraceae bacterium]